MGEKEAVVEEELFIFVACLLFYCIYSDTEGLYSKYSELSSKVPTPGNPSGDP